MYFRMRVHQIIQPEMNDRNILVGIIEVSLHDMGEVLSPFLVHDDVFNFFQDTTMLLATGPGADVRNVNLDNPVGLSAHPDAFPNLLALIYAGGYTQGARNRIRNILGFNSLISPENHGNILITRIRLYLHCDFDIT